MSDMFPLLKHVVQLYRKTKNFAGAHKFVSGVFVIAVIAASWWMYGHAKAANADTRYVLTTVRKITIVSSISASGQVSASNLLDIKPKVSGDVTYVGVTPGKKVVAGVLIAQLDAADAQKAVRDAAANLQSAQISLQKLQKPASALTLTQAEHALSDAQDSLQKLYADSATDITNAFLDLPNIITGLQDIQIGYEACGTSQWNMDCYANAMRQFEPRTQTYRDTAKNDFSAAKQSYDSAFAGYQALGNSPDNVSIEKELGEAYAAVQLGAKAVKSTDAFLQLYSDAIKAHDRVPSTAATNALADLNAYTGTLNSHLSSLLSDTASLKQYKQDIIEKQQSLDQVTAGADSLDIESAQLSVTKSRNALQDAQNNLGNYSIRAPFSGVLAAVNVKKYDTASPGTAIATLITSQRIAELSLNEVDAAKIQVGDKATLTFDAIDGLTLTGKVAQVDIIGTVTQGVVSYSVKIGFDSQDERIKPGMTVNAAIITDVRQDVLAVPSSAVKTQNGMSYVQAFDPPVAETGDNQEVLSKAVPQQLPVETGISDDTNTEIISGLAEGQQVIARTISGSQSVVPSSAPSLFGGGGARAGGARPSGGAVFMSR